jgi:hypothetical protein
MAIDSNRASSRRALLAGSAGGMFAIVAHALGRPHSVLSSHEGSVKLGHANVSTGLTEIANSKVDDSAFKASATGAGVGIEGSSETGFGVKSYSGEGTALWAESDGSSGFGVVARGWWGVFGEGSEVGLFGRSPQGVGVSGFSERYYGVGGLSVHGPGVRGFSGSGPGVRGISGGTAAGVHGSSEGGRGGHFRGKKAQIRLDPSTTATHPSSGDAGDLFVDAENRLWFCKGGTTWVRIA